MMKKPLVLSLLFKFILFAFCLIQTSCSTIKKMEAISSAAFDKKIPEDMCRVIFFNDSHDLLYALSGKMRIGLNNKEIGTINRNEYLEVNLRRGSNELFLEHWDVLVFKSKHDVVFENDTNYVSVKTKPTSNDYRIMESKPDNFEKKYMKAK